jgi:hypothetical protein
MMYKIYNHNNTLIGEFANPAEALKEALFYRHQTGNPAYVEQDDYTIVCPHCGNDAPLTGLIGATADNCPRCGQNVFDEVDK